jgi:hypothetical protein
MRGRPTNYWQRPAGQYLNDASELIAKRIEELASTAARHRPAWTLPLGQTPADPDVERQWLRHVAIIAAYREQYKITSDDPRLVLGPYMEQGHAGHRAYWHAAESVLAARRLAGLDPALTITSPNSRVQDQVAIDIYRALPGAERTAISTEMADRLGTLWFADRTRPDEDATTQAAHSAILASTLIQRGHLTPTEPSAHPQYVTDEPLEAELARRRLARPGRQPDQASRPSKATAAPVQNHRHRHDAPAPRHPQPRIG